ncbi:MAG: AAA family ATPase [Tissierellia bacterium]|nr:AAA family ATPase [Tissierellia bacterium]
MRHTLTRYPFTAIVGQEEMKLALLLNLVNPKIGGVLIRGEKGTAKSTAIRALEVLANGLAESNRSGQSYEYRLVELPLGTTEDRLVGTIDIQKAIREGERAVQYGLLKEADGNILYVDEVNLLDDNLVDLILDAAAMGVNTIEREGISESHPSRFLLVGSMNPEEGELRPQLIDRFGLVVDVTGESDPDLRVEIMMRRIAYEDDPVVFCEAYQSAEEELREKILNARELLTQVVLSRREIEITARLCCELEVDGHRGDLTLLKTAMTLCAYRGDTRMRYEDLETAARLALTHRRRRDPFDPSSFDWEELQRILRELYEMVQ